MKGNILLIERENGEFDKVEFSFRYVNLNKKQLLHIQEATLEIEKSIKELKNSTYVLSISLDENLCSNLFKKINSNLELNDSNYGIWISFTSEYDQSGFRLPKYVKDFYSTVGGQFDCSILNV